MTITKKTGGAIIAVSLVLMTALLWSSYAVDIMELVAYVSQDPSTREPDPRPPINFILSAELPAGTTVQLGELRVAFTTIPPIPIAGEKTKFVWTVTDAAGHAADLHRIMHNIPMHVYALRDDLAGEVIHMHPAPDPDIAVWRDSSTFMSPGSWRIHMQGTLHGVLYEFWTPLTIAGPAEPLDPPKPPDKSLSRTLLDYEVRLEIGSPVRAGVPTSFRFDVRHTPELELGQVVENSKMRHNLIIAKQGSPTLWNHHGDGTVDGVAAKAPVTVKRTFSPEDPFTYAFTFPSPGLWLVYFEYMAGSAQFAVDVE